MDTHERIKHRISYLRKRMLVQPEVCIERAYYMTESYRNTEDQPAVIRRARAFEAVLQHMTVNIGDLELIAGKTTGKERGGSISPELQEEWILDELDLLSTREVDPFQALTDSEKELLKKIVPYWKGKSLRSRWNNLLPAEIKRYDDILIGGGSYCGNNQYYGHASPDFGMVLTFGTEGIRQKIERKMNSVDISDPEGLEQSRELEAMKICLLAIEYFAERYADLAESMSTSERDPDRKKELQGIAENCRRVPGKPATGFYEAIQSLWFVYMCVMIENWGTGNTFLRADQYLYPYYKEDLERGRITPETAYELIALLLIKANESCVVYSERKSHAFAGNNSGASFTLGGVTPDGTCAVNPLSYLFLEAERDVNLNSDDLVIRVADSTPEDFLLSACEVARDVGGKLKFVGDDVIIREMLFDERPLTMAKDYAIVGCTSPTIGGQSYDIPGGIISLPKILELTLNNGKCRITGELLGVETGDPGSFSSYEQLWDAFCVQVGAVIPRCRAIHITDRHVFAEYSPSPFLSSFYPDCIDRGIDVVRGGTFPYFFLAMAIAGAPDVGDGLAAIKKCVFDEKKLTMAQIVEALEHNYEGSDAVLSLLRRAPKFGNNDPYVDTIVNHVICLVSDEISESVNFSKARSTVAAAAVTANIGLGKCLGATPDGRKAGEPISEGGLSPHQGRNTSGPTATMLSVAGLDHMKLRHGEVLNMRFNPDALNTREKLQKFAAMVHSYFKSGGFLVQFNIVSTETLRAAQKHPEKYRDLIVRVATYAAYFIDLGEEIQNDVINRLEFGRI